MEYDFKIKNELHRLSLDRVFKIVRQNPSIEVFKLIDGTEMLVNNQFVLNTQFFCHRINTIAELSTVSPMFGVEFDVRDYGNSLILSHDPHHTTIDSDAFEDYVCRLGDRPIIVNIKSERIEIQIVRILEQYDVQNYVFLDSSLPMIYLLNKKYNCNKIAARYSELEPVEYCYLLQDLITWIWIDCLTRLPLTMSVFNNLKKLDKKLCLVSPDLHGRPHEIQTYREILLAESMIPDAICCKADNIIRWI